MKSVTQLISNDFHILYSEVFAERETKEVGLGDVERGYQNLTYLDNHKTSKNACMFKISEPSTIANSLQSNSVSANYTIPAIGLSSRCEPQTED